MHQECEYKIPIILGVTGHRDIEKAQYNEIESILTEKIQTLILDKYPKSPVKLITPLADGADRLVAKVAIKLGVQIVVALPMDEHIYKSTFLGEDGSAERMQSVSEFDQLVQHGKANEVFVLPQLVDENELANNSEDQARQFALLGAFMAKHCHILIALYDGAISENIGGTSQIVRYRSSGVMNGLPLKIDCEEFEKIDFVMPDNLFDTQHTGILWQVTVSRDSVPNDQEVEFQERITEDSLKTVNYKKSLDKINDFNRDVEQFLQEIKRADDLNSQVKNADKITIELAQCESNLMAADTANGCLQSIKKTYIAADHLAVIFARDHREYFTVFSLFLIGVAVSEWLFSHGINSSATLSAYILCLAVGQGIFVHHRNRSVHNKYNEYRALAEALRVQFYWRSAGLKSVVSDHYLRKHQVDTSWISGAVKAVSYRTYLNELHDIDFVITEWIKGQKDYYEAKLKHFIESKHYVGVFKKILYALMYLSAFLGIYFHSLLSHALLSALLSSIPLLYVLMEHKATYMSEPELMRSYNIYYRLYARAYETLEAAERKGADYVKSAKAIIYQLGCEALIENGDWLIINRDKKAKKPE